MSKLHWKILFTYKFIYIAIINCLYIKLCLPTSIDLYIAKATKGIIS